MITDSGGESAPAGVAKPDSQPGRSPSSSACLPYQDVIELGISRGRNAMAIWQELVDTCGFASGYQSVRRFVSRLQDGQSSEPCAVIETAPGKHYRKFRVMVTGKRQPVWFRANHRDSFNSRFP